MVPVSLAQWGGWCALFALEAGPAFLNGVGTLMPLLSIGLSPPASSTLLYSWYYLSVIAVLCSGRESLGIK